WIIGALVAAAFLLAVGMRQRRPGGGPAALDGVQVATAEHGSIQRRITAAGVVASQTGTMVKIGSQISGRIRSLPADVGSPVRAGQVVAVLDSPDLQAQVDQQRQSVAASAASLAQA